MMFTTTENKTYRQGIGYVPKSWIKANLKDHKEAAELHFRRYLQVLDWDEAFDEEHDFLFDDGRAFRLYYRGWSEWHHEDEEKNGLKSEFYIEEISPEEANVPDRKSRDYI